MMRGRGSLAWSLLLVLVVATLLAVGCRKQTGQTQNNTVSDDLKDPRTHPLDIRKFDADTEDPKVLNVHVVPHTHDDVGWLKTVEQYYYGQNMTIQDACVEDILDSVVEALLENPYRTFVYVEIKFFSMWWEHQTDTVKESVRQLVANQQLGFVNGGWCMHDEAATHFMGMIDQTTLGHAFLKRELGYIPKVGWQLDPFGHSATQASLMTSSMGFDALYFGRIDYQDMEIRHNTQECEGLWSSSASAGNKSTVFWGLTGSYYGNYGAPPGFCFDKRCHYNPLTNMTRPQLVDAVKHFLQEMKLQSDRTKGSHVMLTFGSDFNYQRASTYFANIDLLIKSIDLFREWGLVDVPTMLGPRFERINIFYSSPNYYTQMKHKQTRSPAKTIHTSHLINSKESDIDAKTTDEMGIEWKVKKDDFFPYSDCPHCFWTGYFTSRAAFKKLERVGSSFLMAARQIEALLDPSFHKSKAEEKPLYDLEDAMGVVQHHDAVSGTAKQHVSNDYSKRVQAGINKAAKFVINVLKNKVLRDGRHDWSSNILDNLSFCQLVNETICTVSQEATMEGSCQDVTVVVYNALGSNTSSIVYLPVSVDSLFEVTRLGTAVAAANNTIRSTPSPFGGVRLSSAKYVLAFDTGPLTPVGTAIFRVRKKASLDGSNGTPNGWAVDNARRLGVPSSHGVDETTRDVVASNGLLTVHFDSHTGAMKTISKDETTLEIDQVWGYYTSFDASKDRVPADKTDRADQNSGAYIFRPSQGDQKLNILGYSKQASKFVQTSMGTEVHIEFEEPWVKQVTRVMKGIPYIEVEYMIGPIPITDGRGKEVVTRFSTAIQSNSTFFTDSNGREFLERRRDFRPSWPLEVFEPVAGNYYPVNAAIYVEDEQVSLAVLVDRSQGGASLDDGSVELMAHRRALADDRRGVGEPLNETDGGVSPYPPYGNAHRYGRGLVVCGKYRVMVGKGSTGASLARSEMDSAFTSPLIFVASSEPNDIATASLDSLHVSALQQSLPRNIMLVTFQKLDEAEPDFLVRFGHQYGIHDDKLLSLPVSLDLAALFGGYSIESVTELTLSGNQELTEWTERRLDWIPGHQAEQLHTNDTSTVISLRAMEIRTFKMKMVTKQ
ncbi:Lysosomal alpha-mannosidase [Seminavis robusta]|uniref:Alpha-mannosidase n=1 Tax=Seminavis robusta TaxID=568900 RepID=A0A9N8HMH8_9STRA|nr:Lysosomal alpha-mannosidase [Seminavis robusta]|eukprot:Sro900_g217840.1 Lysosomal alpha-mannosidase (1115) ;mRNA; r:16190-19800